MLSSGSVDVNARLLDEKGEESTALILAAERGHAALVEQLLRAEAEIDNQTQHGQTACHVATQNCRIDVLTLLLARGCDLSMLDAEHRTPLDIAVTLKTNDQPAIALINAGASLYDDSVVCEAAAMSPATAELVFALRDDLSLLRDSGGCTPCHLAVQRGRMDSCATLDVLLRRANVGLHVCDRRDRTCVHSAAAENNADALYWLFEAGADLDAVDKHGWTPLHVACNANNFDATLALVAAGASVHPSDKGGRTACHLASNPADFVVEFSRVVLDLLLVCGADFDAADIFGITPRRLHLVAEGPSPPTVEQLEHARRLIANAQLSRVRRRAFEVCVGLRPLDLAALQVCEILSYACGRIGTAIPFHIWWSIATATKHFH